MWEARWKERAQEVISKAELQLGRGGGDHRVKREAWLHLQSEMQAGVLLSKLHMQPPNSILLCISFNLIHYYYTFIPCFFSCNKTS